jgi:hypothetical protein
MIAHRFELPCLHLLNRTAHRTSQPDSQLPLCVTLIHSNGTILLIVEHRGVLLFLMLRGPSSDIGPLNRLRMAHALEIGQNLRVDLLGVFARVAVLQIRGIDIRFIVRSEVVTRESRYRAIPDPLSVQPSHRSRNTMLCSRSALNNHHRREPMQCEADQSAIGSAVRAEHGGGVDSQEAGMALV